MSSRLLEISSTGISRRWWIIAFRGFSEFGKKAKQWR
jgi:hypothetical protein